jgi:DNA polymerase-3 subunit beta
VDVVTDPGAFAHALRHAGRLLPAHPATATPAGAGAVHFETLDGRLAVRAGDADLGLEITTPATVARAGRVAVPGWLLAAYVTALPPAPVQLVVDATGQRLTLRCGHHRAVLVAVSVATDGSWAPPSVVGGRTIELAAAALGAGIARVAFAAADDADRPVLTAVQWRVDAAGLTLAAADGFRLARARVAGVSGAAGTWLVPARAVAELGRLLADIDSDTDAGRDGATVHVTVAADARAAQVVVGQARLWTRLVAGAYPDVDRLIPSASRTRVVVDRARLVQAVAVVQTFGGDSPVRAARFEAAAGRLRLTARDGDGSDVTSELDAALMGEPGTLSLNLRLLTDILAAVRGPTVELGWTDRGAPVVLRDPAHPDPANVYLVMPLAEAVATPGPVAA